MANLKMQRCSQLKDITNKCYTCSSSTLKACAAESTANSHNCSPNQDKVAVFRDTIQVVDTDQMAGRTAEWAYGNCHSHTGKKHGLLESRREVCIACTIFPMKTTQSPPKMSCEAGMESRGAAARPRWRCKTSFEHGVVVAC